MNKRDAIIIDIDGTLGFDKIQTPIPTNGTREEWDKFHLEHDYFNPENFISNSTIIDIVKNWYSHYKNNIIFIFLTAREKTDINYLNTIELIHKLFPYFDIKNYGIDYMLIMRSYNDFRTDWDVKKDLMKTEILPCCNPIIAIDDKEENIRVFRKLGVSTVLQVYGEYK